MSDPLTVIAAECPALDRREAAAVVREHYGLDVEVTLLVSERDQNFRLRTGDGRRFVLKIANAAEDPAVTECQVRALLHIEDRIRQRQLPIRTPQVLRTRDGRTEIVIERAGSRHVARVVSWVDGVPLGERTASTTLCRNLGRYLAHLGIALRGFHHRGADQSLLWDMKQAPRLRELLPHVPDGATRDRCVHCLDDFERDALPQFDSLRSQVIHSDLNPDNALVDAADTDRVAGVIDFGDMLSAPLIVDVGIAAAYLRAPDGDPLARPCEFAAGYHSVVPLEPGEIDILHHLILARLAASISILYWRLSARPADDPYLVNWASGGAVVEDFLERLMALPADHARERFRAICSS